MYIDICMYYSRIHPSIDQTSLRELRHDCRQFTSKILAPDCIEQVSGVIKRHRLGFNIHCSAQNPTASRQQAMIPQIPFGMQIRKSISHIISCVW